MDLPTTTATDLSILNRRVHSGVRPQSKVFGCRRDYWGQAPKYSRSRLYFGARPKAYGLHFRAKNIESVTLTIKILNAYDKERNIEMGCADHRLSSVCHTHRSWGYVLHGIQLKIEVLTVMCALFFKNILHFSWLVQEKALPLQRLIEELKYWESESQIIQRNKSPIMGLVYTTVLD